MKKVLLLLTFFTSVFLAATAQQQPIPYKETKKMPLPVFKSHITKHAVQNGSRSASNSFFISYAGMDAELAYTSGTGVSYLGDPQDAQDDAPSVIALNTSLPRDSVGFSTYALQVYPRIIDYTTTSFPWNEYDLSKIQINIDTIKIQFGHVKNAAVNRKDTIVISVFLEDDITSLSFDTGVVAAPFWKQVLIVDTSLTGSPQPGYFNIDQLTAVPGISLPANKTFGIQVQFFGPAEDEFYLLAGWKNDCGILDCGADVPYANYDYNANLTDFNSLSPVRFATGDTSTPFFPYPTQLLYNDCDNNDDKNATCEETRMQDLLFYPYITVNIPNFYAQATPDSLFGCPGEVIRINARAFGSSAYPFTYNFTTNNGSIVTVDDSTAELTLGNANSTVILSVTDANSSVTRDTLVIASRGITANINNGNPYTIACGPTINNNLPVTLGGYTVGQETFSWSNDSTTNPLHNVTIGTYIFTITNSAHCTTKDTIVVSYTNGTTNTPSFTKPSGIICQNTSVTFTNTSAKINGWNSIWNLLGDNPPTVLMQTLGDFT
jgi:hypothetical protein